VSEGRVNIEHVERTAFILFTDIYRSTQLWEKFPQDFRAALETHNSTVEGTVLSHGGEIMKNLGDGYIAIFDTVGECITSAVEIQARLSSMPPLPDGSYVLVRVVSHAGPLYPLATGRGYFGRALNRCSRICQVCHPGQVLISGAVRMFVDELPEGARALDLGVFLLRDLGEPEQLYQLDHPKFALHEFPPLPTLDYRPNNLVVQPNAFVGRQREMSELRDLILAKKHRLVTVTAPGGYGKSRLAAQLCADMLDDFAGGVFEVLLAPVGEHTRVVPATATALGFQFYGRDDPKQQLIDYLREKSMLILLDNFEQVMEGKALLVELLQQAPQVSLLVTSREPLRLKAEKVYRLEPLPVTVGWGLAPHREGGDLHEDTGAARDRTLQEELPEAVQLFIDRATLVKHDFALTEENLALTNAICEKLDGVPLSIELAAAWSGSFTLSELLSEVEHQLELTARLSDVEPRHRGIRASLDWSHNLLSDEQREVLRAVSTFKGGFFYEAAMAVGWGLVPHREGGDLQEDTGAARDRTLQKDLRKTLSELCDKGWLFAREVRLGEQALGKTRFFIRDAATHQYAFEKLRQSPDFEKRVLAHAEHFAELTEREAERLKGRDQLEALRVLNLEIENIHEAIDTALNRDRTELLTFFAKHLSAYLDVTGRWREGLPWYEKMAEHAAKEAPGSLQVYASLGLGRLLLCLGRHSEAEDRLTLAREAAEAEGDRRAIAASLNNLGNAAYCQGRYEDAERLHKQSLEAARGIGDRHGVATSLNNLGLVAYCQGRYEETQRLHEESLEIWREIGNGYAIASSLVNLGNVAYDRGRYAEAGSLFEESLEMTRGIGARHAIAVSLNNLGNVAYIQGKHEKAERLYKQSLEIAREIGNRQGVAMSANNLGNVASSQARYAKAETLYRESLLTSREVSDRYGIAISLNNLGFVAYNQGRREEAGKLYEESLETSREIGNRWGAACSLNGLAELNLALGEVAKAADFLKQSIAPARELKDPALVISLTLTSARLLAEGALTSESAILLEGVKHQAGQVKHHLDPLQRSQMEKVEARLASALTEDERAALESRAGQMSPDELLDFALKTLEGIGDRG